MAALAVVIATPFAEAADANQPMFLKVLQPLSEQTQHSNLQVLRLLSKWWLVSMQTAGCQKG